MKTKPGKTEVTRRETSRRASASHQGKHHRHAILALLLVAAPLSACASEHPVAPADATKTETSDLTLGNFFSTGWNEPWARRTRDTPDMSLLRVQTNFLVQLFRTDLALQQNPGSSAARGSDSLTGTLEYAFNRRVMLALIGNYRWLDARIGNDSDAGALAAFARVQLVEKAHAFLATTLRVGLPSHDLGEKDTVVSFALAGWQDLAPVGLSRTGLYFHVQEETLAGPTASGARRNDLTYALSLAKSWTSPEAVFGNATTFLEAYAKTDLDGKDRGHTLVTLTPGVRATFAHRHIVMAGIEFPLTDPRPFERIVRLTYIINF